MTDVLVVDASPTGLMMACQLARHGVRVRIIDEQVEARGSSSRARGRHERDKVVFMALA